MRSIDTLLDELFELLAAGAGSAAVDPHMALKPDPTAPTYFISAPHPVLSLEEMRRPDLTGVMAEVELVLADLPPAKRAAVVERFKALYEALAAETEDGDAEPPSLIYALH
jgi:hypothetical protein